MEDKEIRKAQGPRCRADFCEGGRVESCRGRVSEYSTILKKCQPGKDSAWIKVIYQRWPVSLRMGQRWRILTRLVGGECLFLSKGRSSIESFHWSRERESWQIGTKFFVSFIWEDGRPTWNHPLTKRLFLPHSLCLCYVLSRSHSWHCLCSLVLHLIPSRVYLAFFSFPVYLNFSLSLSLSACPSLTLIFC